MTLFKDAAVPSTLCGAEALVEGMKTGITKRKSKYYTLTLRDIEGSTVKAMAWEESLVPEWMEIGGVIQITGDVSIYNDEKQINIGNITKATKTTPLDYVKSTTKDVSALWDDILGRIENMTHSFCKHLGMEVVKKTALVDLIKKAPAATKIHNNWMGGLIEHIHAMCMLADGICQHYQGYFPNLNKDYVIIGCILHDLGKVFEFDSNNPAFPKTPTGILTNHIVWGPAWVYSKALIRMEELEAEESRIAVEIKRKNLDNSDSGNQLIQNAQKTRALKRDVREGREMVMHLIASHHGRIDYGSPVVPATIEAIILHYVDNLDTHAMHAWNATKKEGNIKGFSERSWTYGTEFKI